MSASDCKVATHELACLFSSCGTKELVKQALHDVGLSSDPLVAALGSSSEDVAKKAHTIFSEKFAATEIERMLNNVTLLVLWTACFEQTKVLNEARSRGRKHA